MPWVLSQLTPPAPFEFTFTTDNIHHIKQGDTTLIFYRHDLIGRVKDSKFIPLSPDYKYNVPKIELKEGEDQKETINTAISSEFVKRGESYREFYIGNTRVAVYSLAKKKLYILDAAFSLTTKIQQTVYKKITLAESQRLLNDIFGRE